MKPIQTQLGQIVNFYNGAEASFIDNGQYTIYGSNGPIGKSRNFNNENAIIVGRVGAYCGSIEIEKNKFWASDNTIVIKPRSDNNLEYLSYLLIRTPLRSYAGGAAQPLLTHTILRTINLKFFGDSRYQGQIADILSNYDNLIDINRRRIQLLEKAARLLFREWFVYFRFPGHEKVKIVNYEGIHVPEGWNREKLNKYVTFKRGVEPGSDNYLESQEDGTFPFYRVSDLGTRNPEIFVDELHTKGALLEKKDIVVSLDGSVGIVSMGLDGCYSTGIRKLIIKGGRINRSFLYCLMKSHYMQGVINAYSKGTTIQHAGESVKHMNPLLPPQKLMDTFGEIIEPAIDEVLTLLDQNQKLVQARDLLLPRLMSGAIDVSEFDIKTPQEEET